MPMISKRRHSLFWTVLLGGLWLVLAACQPPFGAATADPSTHPSSTDSTETPEPTPTPSAGNVQPIITF